ncbi:PADRE domain-containing protein [Hymenobacter metallicola]|uniref:Nucleotide-diphospho-sugar transferase domain-containing protein n=1 Tax=Hymenobacter metallicola TaxID=2563114 RepID=A0A4Z0QH69_9BACT|nr:DUF4228 domain-containing protein [Hymenobacter metallicola]TGE28669.1 hypothetical protein E5K02_04160 [Hymenobacter metallicola]
MHYLVYLAYGRETEYRRAIFAVLSFWAHAPSPAPAARAIIFTDNPAYFRPFLAGLPVEYVPVTPDGLRAMQGPAGYIHRVKIAILDEVMQAYPGAHVLYCDSDTFFVADPAPLLRRVAAGSVFMHQPEYTFAAAVAEYAAFGQAEYPQQFLDLIARRRFSVAGTEVSFRPEQHSWNSGVLGLPAPTAPLLADVYTLTDAFYAATKWFTCEQIAFSLVLQHHQPLHACQQYVFHYWGQRQKQLLDGWLTALLSAEFAALPLLARCQAVRPLTSRWRRQAELDAIREGSLYAFHTGQTSAGVKYAVKAVLQAPFDLSFPKRVWTTLHSRARA